MKKWTIVLIIGGMNEAERDIFESVLSQMIESFAPHLFIVLADFEIQNQTIQSTADADRRLENIFKRFPRKYPQYKSMLIGLSNIAESAPGEILSFVVKMLKHILKGARDTSFSVLQGISTSYDPNNRHHILLFHYFSLFTLTDLICQLVAKFGPGHASIKIYELGYNVATSEPLLPAVLKTLVEQWAVIFSIVSETHFADISSIFSFFNSLEDYSLPLSLIRYLRLDSDDSVGPPFMETIVKIVKQQHKKKVLNAQMLESLASLIITLPGSEDILQKLYNLAYSLRADKNLGSSAILLLCQVVNRSPSLWNRHTHIFEKRVLSVVGQNSKVQMALHTFRLLMYGSNLNPAWYFWKWGPNPRISPLAYIKWNGAMNIPQADERSFSGVFMSKFFAKSDFSVCPHDFRDVLVHLASLDFQNFVTKIIPQFLSLNTTDARFITLLMAVPKINSPDFISNSFKPVTRAQIGQFNLQIKPKIMNSLTIYNESGDINSGVSTSICSTFVSSLIEGSDQKINVILTEWGLNQYGMLLKSHMPTEQEESNFSLIGRLLPALRHVLTPSEFGDPTLMKLIVRLSYHHNAAVSTNAYVICRDVLGANEELMEPYVAVVKDEMMKNACPESSFTCASLLNDVLNNLMKKNVREEIDHSMNRNLLLDIEFSITLMLSSIYPDTRNMAYSSLVTINKLLENNGVMHYISGQKTEIENKVKNKLLLHLPSIKTAIEMQSDDKIDFESALLSHYYEIWLFFLAEIMNVVVGTNYTPVIDKIANIRSEILQAIMNQSHNNNPSDIGLMIIVTATMYYQPRLNKTEFSNNIYTEFVEGGDNRKLFRDTISGLLNSDNDMHIEMGFTILEHTHLTLYPLVFDILNNLQQIISGQISLQLTTLMSQATSTLSIMLKNPELHKSFYRNNFKKFTHFLNTLQFIFVQLNLNGPRIIQWDSNRELLVTRNQAFVKSFCSIIIAYFLQLPKTFSENDWPLSARENVFRQLLNWSMTKSVSLESVRSYSSTALRTIIRFNSFFNDSLLFDENAVTFFGTLEIMNGPVLSNLLKYHLDLLLDTFLIATYTQPRVISDAYMEAIIDNMCEEHGDIIAKMGGQIILLALVSSVRDDIRSNILIEKFVRVTDSVLNLDSEHILEMLPTGPLIEVLPKQFTLLTEAVFSSVFTFLKMPNLHISAKDIIESVRPWMKVIRLLPKQKTIAQNVTPGFNYYTPYAFLVNLMEATEAIDDDQFRSIASLWTELAKSPDHRDLIPLFISNWSNGNIKIKLFGILLAADPLNVSQRLTIRCSFAYYFHVTQCLSYPFSTEMWPAPLLATVFDRNWEALLPQFPSVIHYVILFKDDGAGSLFNVFCKHLHIDRAVEIENNSPVSPKLQGIPPIASGTGNEVLLNSAPKNTTNTNSFILTLNNNKNQEVSETMPTKRKDSMSSFILSLTHKHHHETSTTEIVNSKIAPSMLDSLSNVSETRRPSHTRSNSLFLQADKDDLGVKTTRKFSHQMSQNPQISLESATAILPTGSESHHHHHRKSSINDHRRRSSESPQLQALPRAKKSGKNNAENAMVPSHPLNVELLRTIVDDFVLKMSDEDLAFWCDDALKWVIACSDLQWATASFVIFNRLEMKYDITVINSIIRAVYYHVNKKPDPQDNDARLLCQLVSESFIMLTKCFEGNETLLFNYVFAFLDCRLFVESSLFDARELLLKCAKVRSLMPKMVLNTISFVRPLIPKLESSKSAQNIINDFIKIMPENIELQIIVAPIKSNDPSLFPAAMDVNVLFARCDDSTLCKALSHYSFLMKTSSRSVMNVIFEFSADILTRIPQNENNRVSLAKIYQNALHFMSQCPMAKNFIRVLCKNEPKAATLGIIDVYEWDRAVEDVGRSIKTVIKNDDSPIVTITDCKSYTSVTRFLQPDTTPKILPFAAQREMIEGMKRVKREHKLHRITYRRSPDYYKTAESSIPNVSSEYFDENMGSESQELELTPLMHPEKLMLRPLKSESSEAIDNPLTAADFINEIKATKSSYLD